jgi:two-component system cell cycle sensor histidine kinase/response regulator CckA
MRIIPGNEKASVGLGLRVVPYCVLAVTMTLAFIAWRSTKEYERAHEWARFNHAVDETNERLQSPIKAYITLLDGLRGLANARLSMSNQQFKSYVEALQVRRHYSGVDGLGFSARVPRDEKVKAIERVRGEGEPTFHIWPDADQPASYPIVWVEPRDERNAAVIGYDLLSEAGTRTAIDRAVETGEITVTEKFALPREDTGPKETGFLILQPVYWGGTIPDSPEERRRLVFSFFFGMFQSHDLFKALVPSESTPGVSFKIYDGNEFDETHLLYDSSGGSSAKPVIASLSSTRKLRVADKTWSVIFSSEQEFAAATGTALPSLIFVGGVAMSLLVFGLTLSQVKAHGAAQERLGAQAAAEAKFRRLVEQSLVGIYIIQNDRFVYVNPKITEILGFSENELTSGLVSDFILPADRRSVRENLEKRVRGEVDSIRYGLRMIRKDGRVIEVEVHGGRSDYNGEPAVLGTLLDISERKQTERRLELQHAVTEVLAEAAPLAQTTRGILEIIGKRLEWDVGDLWTVDQRTEKLRCVEIWHPRSTEFLEFAAESRPMLFGRGEGLPGRVWDSGEVAWISDLTRDECKLRRKLAPLGLRGAICFPIKLQEKVIAVMEFFSGNVRDPDLELLALFSTIGTQLGQFIERKELEEQLRHAQKMEAVGQLAGGVAHDFNNMLTIINGYAGMLLTNEEIVSKEGESLKQIYEAGERAAHLTQQLLMFSRKKEIKLRTLDLNEVVEDVAKMLRRLIGADIHLELIPHKEKTWVEGDLGMMEQVLMNLAVNARDAMPTGGRLTIRTELLTLNDSAKLEHPDARKGEYVSLIVQDTGCGMSPEVVSHIFEPFFTTKEVGKGTGLGLATVYGIAKQHQGWVEVESVVGAGTTFRVFLPSASLENLQLQANSIETTKTPRGNETILLVEDDVAVRALASTILRKQGYKIIEAGTGGEALNVWRTRETEIDLLLTDMVMPGKMTGKELAQKLRAMKGELKVIYASGYAPETRDDVAEDIKKIPFLEKPYAPIVLLQMVRQVLDEDPTTYRNFP